MPRIILQATAISSGLLLSTLAHAEGWTRIGSDKWSTQARGSMRSSATDTVSVKAEGWTSLNRFEGRKAPSAAKSPKVALTPPPMGAGIEGLRKLIRFAESRQKGYDAIHHSAKRLPGKRPTEMTIAEILAWISATPGQHHAIGQYQFIPTTLKRLLVKTGLPVTETFSAQVQDRLADVLILEAGYHDFKFENLSSAKFMDGLAKIWTGLPMQNGRSAYRNIAGNRATISRAFF